MIVVGLALLFAASFSTKGLGVKPLDIKVVAERMKAVREIPSERAARDENPDLDQALCMGDQLGGPVPSDMFDLRLAKASGTCCAKYPGANLCSLVTEMCVSLDKGDLKEAPKKQLDYAETVCDTFCEGTTGTKPDWCSSGLSTGAIAGIAVGVIVVVGVAVGLAVFFLVIKKKGGD
jgi:hypothetical protein